jgi:putative ABC transport system permease protein
MKNALLREMILIALRSIRTNLLRTVLTIAVIGLGITALISMTTATSSLEANVEQQFSTLGTNVFSIRRKAEGGLNRGRRINLGEPISYQEAQKFAELSPEELTVSYSIFGSQSATIGRGSKQTNPNIAVLGIDEHYLTVSGYEIDLGRNFTASDANSANRLVLIGSDISAELFEPWEDPIGEEVTIGSQPYSVAGLLKEKGQGFGMSQDNQCYIPIPCLRQQYSDEGRSYSLSCSVKKAEDLTRMAEVSTGILRVIRGDKPGEDSSFGIAMSNGLVSTLKEATQGITLAASFIGIITLFGAGIGLMNIMLVSVSERTREIGTRKALGASPKAIRTQFLVEVIIIGQMGGLTGILLGLIVGNLIASFMETPFVIPWGWMALGIFLSFITSIASGYYPARKAARLDPIIALGRE